MVSLTVDKNNKFTLWAVSPAAANGQRVVAMINDEVTLKYFYEENDHIRLEPANKTMQPLLVELGVLTVLILVLAISLALLRKRGVTAAAEKA